MTLSIELITESSIFTLEFAAPTLTELQPVISHSLIVASAPDAEFAKLIA